MSKRKWTRVLALASAVALAAGTSPALARGNKPPPKSPETVTVTMTYEVSGFATAVECGGSVTMTLNGAMLLMDWEDTAVEMSFGPMSGCHGPLVAESDEGYSGNFGLAQQRDGTVRLGSRFDYYWEFEALGKRTVQKTLDFYEVTGDLTPSSDFDWSPGGGGTLTGSILLRQFHKVYKAGEWTDIGSFDVTFTVTIGS